MTIQGSEHCNRAVMTTECDGFEIGVRSWGREDAPAVLLMHGLGGHSKNFEHLARALARYFYCIAPDMIGRGLSTWSANPARDYCFETYERIIVSLADTLGLKKFMWLGVSMGGALGIRLSASTFADRIIGLIVNDVGTELNPEVAKAIFDAMSVDTRFGSISELASHMESAFGSFGMKQSANRTWTDMALNSARRRDDGTWSLHFDSAVAQHLRGHLEDFALSEAYSALQLPLLLFRGSESNVLTQDMAETMIADHPDARFALVEGVGHAPLLDRPEDIGKLTEFLSYCGGRAV